MSSKIQWHQRAKWTSHTVWDASRADAITNQPWFRNPKGIIFYSSPMLLDYSRLDPSAEFEQLRHEATSRLGLSDIRYNLGISGGTDGVWNLRGLQNKSSASSLSSDNDELVSVFICAGSEEKPTDALLRNILDARRLVLSRYPGAASVSYAGPNLYLKKVIGTEDFFEKEVEKVTPVGNFSLPLDSGYKNVHVQALQEHLAFWGYYRIRVTGEYNIQTVDAVRELQLDLKDKGLFDREANGVFTLRTGQAWERSLS